jgi:putative hydrolase of the HAD superfamily
VTRAVLFDVGDTLVRRPEVGPGRRIAEALGLAPEAARAITRLLFREAFETPVALAARLRRDLGCPATVERVVAEIWEAQESEPEEVPGATACVLAAAAAGARVGVVSNIWAPYEAGFRRACPAIVPLIGSWHLSYRAGVAKPDPALFQAALAALDVRPEDGVMVGDSLDKDILPALALGMGAIWISAGAAADVHVPAGGTIARDLAHAGALLTAALRSRGSLRAALPPMDDRAIGRAAEGVGER